jgi:hypothetical protein
MKIMLLALVVLLINGCSLNFGGDGGGGYTGTDLGYSVIDIGGDELLYSGKFKIEGSISNTIRGYIVQVNIIIDKNKLDYFAQNTETLSVTVPSIGSQTVTKTQVVGGMPFDEYFNGIAQSIWDGIKGDSLGVMLTMAQFLNSAIHGPNQSLAGFDPKVQDENKKKLENLGIRLDKLTLIDLWDKSGNRPTYSLPAS